MQCFGRFRLWPKYRGKPIPFDRLGCHQQAGKQGAVLDAQRGGQVQVGLYASEAAWDEQDAITGEMARVDGDTVTVVFENLADGAYGIMLFQDFDSDGELDMNAFGIPSEPYAFSNNATGRFGPARWSDAHFMVAGSAEQSISLD